MYVATFFGCSVSEPAPATEAATGPAAQQADDRNHLLDVSMRPRSFQLYADDFSALPLREKTLIWHLYRAAIAGRDIYYDQRHRHNLDMRDVLEAIVSNPSGVDAPTLAEIQRYTKLFWLNTGPYNNLTARKFVLKCTPELAAAKAAAVAGAQFPTRSGESLDALMVRLQPMFFDPNVDPSVTNKTPGPGKDILEASANNQYVGVTLKELEGFNERYPLNSRLVDRNGKLIEEVYRVNGRYGPQIAEIIRHRGGRSVCHRGVAAALKALIKVYRTGETGNGRHYIAWVQDKSSLSTHKLFHPSLYGCPRDQGSWEALVFYVNRHKTEEIQKLAREAQWFEDHMPWDPKYRKEGVQGITANAIDVVIETGDSGPVTPVGINLPNDQSVRERYGSKSVSLSNVNVGYDKSASPEFRSEFSWTPEEAARSEKWGNFSGELTTNMHEVIGHASGKVAERLKGRPQEVLKEQFSALEEARADLVGLYFLPDPKVVELGLVPAADHSDVVKAEYESYTRNASCSSAESAKAPD